MIQSSLIAKLFTSSIQTTTIQVVPQKCLRSRLNSCKCTLCVDLCPNNALSLDGNTIQVNAAKCRGCMLCSTICSNDALSSHVDTAALLMDGLPASDTFTVTCKHQQQYVDDEVVLPCLAALSAEALLYLRVAEGGSTILFNARHCSTCHNQKSFEVFKEVFTTITHLASELTKSSLVLQTQKSTTLEQPTRRVFLKSITSAVSSQSQNQHRARRTDCQTNPCNRTITKNRALIKAAKPHISSSQNPLFSKLTENRMNVNDRCIPCNRCSGICPTGAFTLTKSNGKKHLAFDSEKCSGCQLCVLFCKEKALTSLISPVAQTLLTRISHELFDLSL